MPTVSTPRSRAAAPAPSKKSPSKTSAQGKAPAVISKAAPSSAPRKGGKALASKENSHEGSFPRPNVQAFIHAAPPIGLVDDDLGPLPSNEVFDEADGAQHLQLREQADVQRRALLANRPEHHPDFDGEHCVVCDVAIPKARLLLFKVRCVDCQRELETHQGRLR